MLSLTSGQSIAGPGTLVNSPLFLNTSAPPNIMFVVDNSRSMAHVAEEDYSQNPDSDRYNKTTTYIKNCTSPVASDQKVYIFIDSDGEPKVRFSHDSGTEFEVDYNSGNISTGDICFDPTTNYSAGLNATDGNEPEFNFTALYTGNYLNWYFTKDNTSNTGGSVGTDWESSQRIKPGTQTRKTIAEDSLSSLVTALEVSDVDIRLGLATFNDGSSGAKILDEIKLLNTTQRDSIKSNLTSLGTGFGTPLAETLHQIGRYFIGESGTENNGNLSPGAGDNDTNGEYKGNLTIHPDTASKEDVDVDTLFANEPKPNSSRQSPIQYWCQSNFAVVMTDGLPTVDGELAGEIPNAFQDYDSDCDGADPACGVRDMKDTSLGYKYEDLAFSPSDFFDDVAQAMYEIDLRPDINDYDGNPIKNNVTTYTIAFADQDALNNKLIQDAGTQGGGEAINAADGQDLIKKFTEATNAILSTISSAASVTFSSSALGGENAIYLSEFSTSRWSGEIFSFSINDENKLTGGFVDFSCTADVDNNCWLASTHLDALAYNKASEIFVNKRQILTFDSANKKGIPFRAPVDFSAPSTNELTSAMVNDLCAGPDAPEVSGTACTSGTTGPSPTAKEKSQEYVEQMVNYIRGDRTYEDITKTPTFRTRQTVLGDIIHAAPVFIGSPTLPWRSDEKDNPFGVAGNRYSDFRDTHKDRTNVLYASSNDGMLHAIRAKDKSATPGDRELGGDEIFAFMPEFIFSDEANKGYHYLATPTYEHKYYLDLSPTFSDYYGRTKDSAQADFKTASDDWHTILIGGSRGGSKKGIFALDVTNPENINEANAANAVLWEFTSAHDSDLGHTFSQPTVALTSATTGSGPTKRNRWAVIFGNGYQHDDGSAYPAGVTCRAYLYIVFLDGGLDGVWTAGTNPSTADYIKIDTKVGSTAATGECNGLSSPALADLNGDQVLDRVYAGDVQGNMWAFDLTDSSDFKVAYGNKTKPEPLFKAKDSNGKSQPIMMHPRISRSNHERVNGLRVPMVLFGTGKYHTTADNISTDNIHTFYGILDDFGGNATDARAAVDLVEQTLDESTINDVDGFEVTLRSISNNPVDYGSKFGWYIDLSGKNTILGDGEERVIVTPVVIPYKNKFGQIEEVVFFNTLIPNSTICGSGGSGWLMAVNTVTGAAPQFSVFDANHDGVVDDKDTTTDGDIAVGEKIDGIPSGSGFSDGFQYTNTSGRKKHKRKTKDNDKDFFGRYSWRELRSDN